MGYSSGKKKSRAQAYEKHPFLMSTEETAERLQTIVETGLTDVKVQELQQLFGLNKLEGEGDVKWYSILAKQVSNAMILVRTDLVSLYSIFFPFIPAMFSFFAFCRLLRSLLYMCVSLPYDR
jgi:magnesium-transporting ATPase (P-type)